MRIACVLVAYNPVIHLLESNIQSYYNDVDYVFIINNSSYSIDHLLEKTFKNIRIINNFENMGIAKALNIGCELAINNGFDYVLTLDQDSYFSPSMANPFFETTEKLFATIPDLGIVAPSFQEKEIPNQDISTDFIYRNTVITSGNVLKLSAYNKITNGFDDKLFIDGVDLDFCFKLRINNFKIIELTSIYLRHQIGKTFEKKQLFKNIKYIIHLHNPIRQYYAARNNLYLVKKYRKDFPKETTHIFISLLHKIKNNLFHNSDKIAGLNMTCRGIFHFIVGRYGKL